MPLSSNPDGIELEHVPTMGDLVKQNLARLMISKNVSLATGKTVTDTRYQASPEGQQLIYDIQLRNAKRLREHHDQKRDGSREPARPEGASPADDWPF